MIASDFAIRDATRHNDVFAYTVFPYDQTLEKIREEVKTVAGADIKAAAHQAIGDIIWAANELGIDPETVRRLRRFQNQGNINLALLGDIILASSFAAFVAYLLLKTGVAQAISWMPDRDSITSYDDSKIVVCGDGADKDHPQVSVTVSGVDRAAVVGDGFHLIGARASFRLNLNYFNHGVQKKSAASASSSELRGALSPRRAKSAPASFVASSSSR